MSITRIRTLSKNSFTHSLIFSNARQGRAVTVAALRIIDAAELAYALQYVHEHEAQNVRVIDAETAREVSK